VELTPSGEALLVHARRALADVEEAVEGARRAERPADDAVSFGYGPLSYAWAARLQRLAEERRPHDPVGLEEGLTPDLLRRVATGKLTAAVVMETPGASARHRVRIDPLRDEPLLAALPAYHPYAAEAAIPVEAFVAECVLLPREPMGAPFNHWLASVLRAEGYELDRTLKTPSAPWDHRMLPVARGEAVSPIVGEWTDPPIPDVVGVPFDPPLSFPIDLASSSAASSGVVEAALALRDRDGWLSHRAPASSRSGS
jgi:DNA-binding transcriptional LysR family regulator